MTATNSKIGAQHLNTSTEKLRKFWFRLDFVGLAIKCGIIPEHRSQPRFQHDCPECKFLGTHFHDQYYDLYWCNQGGLPTVIARYGNDGPDYTSGMSFTSEPLMKAKELAAKAGHKVA